MAEFGGPSSEVAALRINANEDLWSKYAFKVATDAGKMKVMSLAIVWSYFHALRELGSSLARHLRPLCASRPGGETYSFVGPTRLQGQKPLTRKRPFGSVLRRTRCSWS